MTDLNGITLFAMAKKRLNWLGQRQEVLSQNIANADTPKYQSRDLKPFNFKELLRRESAQLNMAASSSSHLTGRQKRIRDFAEDRNLKAFETAPAGNSVVLEEQMAKIGETGANYKMTTGLYSKHLGMIKSALGTR